MVDARSGLFHTSGSRNYAGNLCGADSLAVYRIRPLWHAEEFVLLFPVHLGYHFDDNSHHVFYSMAKGVSQPAVSAVRIMEGENEHRASNFV